MLGKVTKFHFVLITNEGDIHKNVVGGASEALQPE